MHTAAEMQSERSSLTWRRPYAFLIALIVLGSALLLTNHWFPVVDDECAIIDNAAQPLHYTAARWLSGEGEHEHPPLYDLILHGWLRLTNGNIYLLRVPAIAFYLCGIWVLAAAAKRLGNDSSAMWVLILTVFWPFGFHFGRVATWYSFCFLLVSLLTWTYLQYANAPTLLNWSLFTLCALALVYSNYFGWVLIALLIADLAIRNPRAFAGHWKRLAASVLLLVVAYAPIFLAFLRELHSGIHSEHSLLSVVLLGIYNLYCLFVSESVAPWFWTLGVPAGIAVAVCLTVILLLCPWSAKRFFFYFVALLGTMAILGIVGTKRLLFVAPWLILPLAVLLSALPKASKSRRVCLFSVTVVAAIGWYGIFARTLYAAPHWVEPWSEVAHEAASVERSGGIVIGNNASFFFYVTYLLPQERNRDKTTYFSGLLPDSTRRERVYDPQQWLAEGRPLRATVLFVEGLHYDIPEAPTQEAQQYLDARCSLTMARKFVYDPGAIWKERFDPGTGQRPWRVHISTYSCRTDFATALQ